MKGKSPGRAAEAAKGQSGKKPKTLRPLTATPEPTSMAGKAKAKAKDKRVEVRFSMPHSDYELIARLKETSKLNGQSVKKNELIRAGLRVLSAMPEGDLLAALAAVNPAKIR